MRWYARTFYTPLHIVEEEVPLDDVLRTWFEDQFESLSEEGRLDEARRLTETPEERAQREAEAKRENLEDEEFYARFKKATSDKKLTAPAEKAAPAVSGAKKHIEEALAKLPEVTIQFSDEDNLPEAEEAP